MGYGTGGPAASLSVTRLRLMARHTYRIEVSGYPNYRTDNLLRVFLQFNIGNKNEITDAVSQKYAAMLKS